MGTLIRVGTSRDLRFASGPEYGKMLRDTVEGVALGDAIKAYKAVKHPNRKYTRRTAKFSWEDASSDLSAR